VAPPRITKPGEEWILKQVQSCEPDGYLIRNYDHLEHYADARRIADFSFNVSNAWSAAWLLNQFKLERLTASYDLNIEQLKAFLASVPTDRIEITLHQHMPMFHMEHCVFCAFLSTGKDYRDCGRPCEKHHVELRDRVGQRHTLKADAGCRNTVFNGRAQTGAEYATLMQEMGVRHFRVEFISEKAGEVTHTLQTYQDLLQGKRDGASVWRDLKLINQLGVTRGTLETQGIQVS
jgi:putative protease